MAFSQPYHFNIVALETFFTGLPPLSVPAPHTFSLTSYERTTVAEIASRIKDADILITTTIPLRDETLSEAVSPKLKLVIALASGTDTIDLQRCRERGIRVLNSPGCNTDAVAEHALALYFAARRTILPTMKTLRAGEWPKRGTLMKDTYAAGNPPRGCENETVAIFGYGGVGKRAAKLFGSLGMKVIVGTRKGEKQPAEGRTLFEEAIAKATVIVLCCPLTPDTRDLLSTEEFKTMQKDAILVNVSRGGVVNEAALLEALQLGQIAGAGVDVFAREPASPEFSPLLGDAAAEVNLVVTPHSAWIAENTTTNYQKVLQENIDGFIQGKVVEERIRA